MHSKHLILWFCLWNATTIQSQDTIYLQNPSFEDTPRRGGVFVNPIKGWEDCGLRFFPGESPVDIHPTHPPAWGVINESLDGDTYLGLVVRYNNTWESVCTRLQHYLKADNCYQISMWLSMSSDYKSGTLRSLGALENFSTPVTLSIWGSEAPCKLNELLASSEPVDHDSWKEYVFEIQPVKTFHYLILQASYALSAQVGQNGETNPYNGNILIDNISCINRIPCGERN